MELTVDPFTVEFRGDHVTFTLEVPRLSFHTGKICFIMGHNGSGKSVLLKTLSGQIHPDAGPLSILLGGRRYDWQRQPLAIVRQDVADNLAYDLTVRENLLAKLRGYAASKTLRPSFSRREDLATVVAWHKDLTRKLDSRCNDLSLGQKQALSFMSVSSTRSPLLMLDEFLASTDVSTSHLLRGLIRKHADDVPCAVLIVSHDIRIALNDADRIIILRQGRIVFDIPRGAEEWAEDRSEE